MNTEKWARWIAGIGILLSLSCVIAELFFFANNLTPAEYVFGVLMLCFAFSSISLLMFSQAEVSIRGSIGAFTLTICGQAALWLVAFLIVQHFYPPAQIHSGSDRLASLADLEALGAEVDSKDGWESYLQWKTHLKSLQDVVNKDEANPIEEWLNCVYYTGPVSGHSTLDNPTILTMFVYLPSTLTTNVLAFTRITGVRLKNQDHAGLYFGAKSTLASAVGRANSVLLLKKDNVLQEIYADGTDPKRKNWRDVSEDPIDCLIVKRYEEDIPEHGDWITVDVTKYLGNGAAKEVFVGIISDRRVDDNTLALWMLRRPSISVCSSNMGCIPLCFRRTKGAVLSDVGALSEALSPWLALLDREVTTPTPTVHGEEANTAREFLNRCLAQIRKETITNCTFTSLLGQPCFTERRSFHLEEVSNPVVVTFDWR